MADTLIQRLARRLRRAWQSQTVSGIPEPDAMLQGRESARNVVVLSEFINATYFISFDLPGRRLADRGLLSIATFAQAGVERIAAHEYASFAKHLKRHYRPTAVIFSRFRAECGLQIIRALKDEGVPTVYHIDDDLLELPKSLGAGVLGLHGSDAAVEARKQMLSAVDMVYTSTAPLAKRLSDRIPGQAFVHGIYAPYLEQLVPATANRSAEDIVFGYAGSRGHQADLDAVAVSIASVLDGRPSASFEVFGTVKIPPSLARFGNRVTSRQVNRDYVGFLAELASLSWDFGLIPLEDSPFNRCRACTKFVEYSACGVPSIVADMPVYNRVVDGRSGVLVGPNDWEAAINRLCDDTQLRAQLIRNARATCRERFSPSTLETQVLEVIDHAIRFASRLTAEKRTTEIIDLGVDRATSAAA